MKNETVNFDVGDESEGVEAPEAAGDAFEVVPLAEPGAGGFYMW